MRTDPSLLCIERDNNVDYPDNKIIHILFFRNTQSVVIIRGARQTDDRKEDEGEGETQTDQRLLRC